MSQWKSDQQCRLTHVLLKVAALLCDSFRVSVSSLDCHRHTEMIPFVATAFHYSFSISVWKESISFVQIMSKDIHKVSMSSLRRFSEPLRWFVSLRLNSRCWFWDLLDLKLESFVVAWTESTHKSLSSKNIKAKHCCRDLRKLIWETEWDSSKVTAGEMEAVERASCISP